MEQFGGRNLGFIFPDEETKKLWEDGELTLPELLQRTPGAVQLSSELVKTRVGKTLRDRKKGRVVDDWDRPGGKVLMTRRRGRFYTEPLYG